MIAPILKRHLIELHEFSAQRRELGLRVGADGLGLLALGLGQRRVGRRRLRKLAIEAGQQRRAGGDALELRGGGGDDAVRSDGGYVKGR